MTTAIVLVVGGIVVYFLVKKVQAEIAKDRAQERKREAWRKYAAKRRARRKVGKA